MVSSLLLGSCLVIAPTGDDRQAVEILRHAGSKIVSATVSEAGLRLLEGSDRKARLAALDFWAKREPDAEDGIVLDQIKSRGSAPLKLEEFQQRLAKDLEACCHDADPSIQIGALRVLCSVSETDSEQWGSRVGIRSRYDDRSADIFSQTLWSVAPARRSLFESIVDDPNPLIAANATRYITDDAALRLQDVFRRDLGKQDPIFVRLGLILYVPSSFSDALRTFGPFLENDSYQGEALRALGEMNITPQDLFGIRDRLPYLLREAILYLQPFSYAYANALLDDRDPRVRAYAVVRMQETECPDFYLPRIRALLRDRSPLVRRMALKHLVGRAVPDSKDLVSRALDDRSDEVRTAALGYVLLSFPDLVPKVKRLIEGGSVTPDIWLLRQAMLPASEEDLKRWVRSPNPELRVLSLGQETPSLWDRILVAQNDRNPKVKAALIVALQGFSGPKATAIRDRISAHPRLVGFSSDLQLARDGKPELALPRLAKYLNSRDKGVRHETVECLSQICLGTSEPPIRIGRLGPDPSYHHVALGPSSLIVKS